MSSKWLDSPSRPPTPVSSGRYAIRPPPPVTPTSATRPEMPAVKLPVICFEQSRQLGFDDERITQISAAPPAEPRTERHVLLLLDGVDAGSVVQLEAQSFSIGRGLANDLRRPDGGVSRTHARITWLDGRHLLEDLDSSNRTFVNGEAVTRALLNDGDVIQLGSRASFRYTRADAKHEGLLCQLVESSTVDALTGVYNRRHFDERLRAELAFAARHRCELSMLSFDIDLFKRINDAHGHAAGDAVLRHVAQVTQRQLRNGDIFARCGGEEFSVLLRGIALKEAIRAAERIRTNIEALPTGFESEVIGATVSVGCASLSECASRDSTTLVQLADARMYAAKRAGRNRVVGGASS